MSRPRTEAEYLARLVPSSVAGIGRRSLLTGVGAGALLGTGLLAGCGSDSGSGSDSKEVSVGSNQSDPQPKGSSPR